MRACGYPQNKVTLRTVLACRPDDEQNLHDGKYSSVLSKLDGYTENIYNIDKVIKSIQLYRSANKAHTFTKTT